MPADHDAYAALRHRDYRLLLAGAVLTSVGSGVQLTAVSWELYDRTGSLAVLALIGLVLFIPVLLLSLLAGQAADRYSRKGLFQLAQGLGVLAALGLTTLSLTRGPVPLFFVCLFVTGIARAFSGPARTSLLPQVVPLDVLHNAVTWNSSGWQFASVTGPTLGGFLLWASASTAYLVTAGCALACILLLIPVRPLVRPGPAVKRSVEALLEGVRFVWRTKLMLAAITLDLFAVLLGGATALLPAYAEDILHVGTLGYGVLRAAPAAGALLMGVVLAHRRPLERPGRALLLGVAGFGGATIAFGLSENFLLSFAMLALAGALDNISVVVRGTLMQMLTPDEMRGRVAAVNTVFISSSNELGEFESGTVAFFAGSVFSVVSGGIGTIVVVVLVALRWPMLWRLGPLHQLHLDSLPEPARTEADRSA
jgi:MFS family permease